jgi:hypothetical protein
MYFSGAQDLSLIDSPDDRKTLPQEKGEDAFFQEEFFIIMLLWNINCKTI